MASQTRAGFTSFPSVLEGSRLLGRLPSSLITWTIVSTLRDLRLLRLRESWNLWIPLRASTTFPLCEPLRGWVASYLVSLCLQLSFGPRRCLGVGVLDIVVFVGMVNVFEYDHFVAWRSGRSGH